LGTIIGFGPLRSLGFGLNLVVLGMILLDLQNIEFWGYLE
jgi:hypothetical protein